MSTTDNNVHSKVETTNNERQRLDGFVWDELHRSMSSVISEAISQIGSKPRESIVTNNPQQGHREQDTILLIGRTMISFRLPKSINAHINLDEIDRSKDKPNGEYTIKTGLCFMKRLEGWTIERLQCKTCFHFDTIYRHVGEKKQFRSVTGALKYIFYGQYPLIQDKIGIYIGEQSTTVKLDEEIHAKLVKVIREIISDAVSPLIKRPADFAPQANERSIVPYSGRTKRRKISHMLLGELHTSFVIPEDSEFACFNIDQIERPNHFKKMYTASNIRRFCFNERLTGWIVERTKRENGVCDMFYYHSGLGKTLRSMTEVVNFLLYEVYPIPANSRKECKMTPEKGLYVVKTPKARLFLTKEEGEADILVVSFLRQSLQNMQIVRSHKSTADSKTGAGNQSQRKKDKHEKEKDTEEELPNGYEPLLALQAQPNDSGGADVEVLKAIPEGIHGGEEGNVERDNRNVEDSSKEVQQNEEQNNTPKSLEVAEDQSLMSLEDICELPSSCEVMKWYTDFENMRKA